MKLRRESGPSCSVDLGDDLAARLSPLWSDPPAASGDRVSPSSSFLKNGGGVADSSRMTTLAALLATTAIAQIGYSVIVLVLIAAGITRLTKRNRR